MARVASSLTAAQHVEYNALWLRYRDPAMSPLERLRLARLHGIWRREVRRLYGPGRTRRQAW
jgi:hypothetical protein